MSQLKATPGPWEVDPHRSRISVINPAAIPGGSRGGGGRLIAATPVSPYSVQAPTAVANAHLIAAAPELYEALTQAVRKLRLCAISAGSAEDLVDVMLEPFNAALSKARGEVA